jgi:NAD(P)-dependent dehydrogenase (short-subunit alcohol dehydrogenase family)
MIILITGSYGFIGGNLKEHLSKKGHTIIDFDLHDIENPIDALDEYQVREYFSKLSTKYQKIDALVNCIGIPDSANKLNHKSLVDIDTESFKKMVDVNLNSVFVIIREFVRNFGKTPSNIINISSLYSVVSPRTDFYGDNIKHPGYVASKFGLVGLTKYLAVLLAKNNIKVNCIAPSAVAETLGVEGDFLNKFNQQVPLKRPVSTLDVAKLTEFLILNNNNITGQNLIIDGGYTLW